ncbi:MAG: peroxiredoxin [Ignavibacteriae bacterium]|nr:peroxiredoxin [Ignavibacteriota bacterium]
MRKLFLLFIVITLISCGGSAENLSVGNKAPDFTLQDSDGNFFTLSEYKGKSPVVIYFYPKANTPGCTTEACGIRDQYSQFKENGIVIFGISVDSKEDNKNFINDHNLNFPLLSDETKSVSESYGVLNNIGKASRITFIIDKDGNFSNIIRDVNVETHADQVFELAKKLL